EPDGVAAPGEACVLADNVLEQAACEPNRSVAEREQTSRRLLHEHRTALLLDELDEAVGGLPPEPHGQKLREHTFDVHFGHGFRVSRRIPRSPESGLFKEMRTRIIRP